MSLLLKNLNFSLYWFAQSLSQLGNAFHLLALPLWVYSLTGSPISTGAVTAAGLIPSLALSPIAGVLADRMNRKVLLIISDVVRAGLVLSLLLVKSSSHIWVVYVIAVGIGIMTTFFIPTQTAMVQGTVKKSELTNANSLLQFSFSGALFLGPIIGGAVLQRLGFEATFVLNATSFILGALGSLVLKVPKTELKPNSKSSTFLAELKEGFNLSWESLPIRKTLMLQLFVFLGTGANAVLFVLHLQNAGASAQQIGMYMSAQGLGMIVGSIFFPTVARKVTNIWDVTLVNLVIMGLAVSLFILVVPTFIYIGMACIFVFGAVLTSFNIASRTLLQSVTPPVSMARVAGISRVIITGVMAVATLIGSSLATLIGPRSVVAIGGFLIIIVGICFWIKREKPEIINLPQS
ncbi:MFS transporter [Mesorhizobium sp. M00.F.Ca.ET.186.01.1.1]|nr:MFS transporter [Mesorhizobium sp. M00.F.Ca.ET.186.01.1.1]